MTLTACSTSGTRSSGCDWVKPLYVDKADLLSQDTKRAILLHNQNWSDICFSGSRV